MLAGIANEVGSANSSLLIPRLTNARTWASGIINVAACKAATLKVLLGEIQLILLCATGAVNDENGVYALPLRVKSQ